MEKNYSLETFLQDDRITDEEWLALGKILDIKNILNKNKNTRIFLVRSEFYNLLGYDKIADKEWLGFGKMLKIKNILNKSENERINLLMPELNLNFSRAIGSVLDSSFVFETSILQMPPPESEINKILANLEKKYHSSNEEKSICNATIKFFKKQTPNSQNFLNEIIKFGKDYDKIKKFASDVSKIYKDTILRMPRMCYAQVYPMPSLKELIFGDKKKLEMEEMERKKEKIISSIISAHLIIIMIKKRLIISDFFKEIDDGKIETDI